MSGKQIESSNHQFGNPTRLIQFEKRSNVPHHLQNDNMDGAKRLQILDVAKWCFLAQGFDGALRYL